MRNKPKKNKKQKADGVKIIKNERKQKQTKTRSEQSLLLNIKSHITRQLTHSLCSFGRRKAAPVI